MTPRLENFFLSEYYYDADIGSCLTGAFFFTYMIQPLHNLHPLSYKFRKQHTVLYFGALTMSIVVAIDFGTTFSGVAWAQTKNPDVHYVINQWPQDTSTSLGGMTSDKVPSEITYEDDDAGPVCRWGFQIPDSMPRIQWIKLGLAPDQKLGINSRLSLAYKDSRRAPPPYHASEEDVVTDYLRSLREHTVKVLESKIGRAFKGMTLDFIITVPAMWPESAKAATFACAEEAGLGKASKLRIISEPEAAAIYALQASNPHGLEVGDTIVLCDAGGGTVDLITFSILELRPSLRLKEEAPGTGALCGSTFLNRRFEEFLERRLSSCPGWDRDTREEALQRFETVAKRTFSGNVDDDFYFPVPGIADDKATGVRRGRLRVTGQEMKNIFYPVFQNVHELVQNQVKTSSKIVKGIFLVGGFGQSPYLRKYLHDYFSPDIDVLAPVNGWTAVVRGALMKNLGEACPSATQASVESRIARKHYGLRVRTNFDPEVHDDSRKYWDNYHGRWRIEMMEWFIQKGDAIKEGHPIQYDLHQHQHVSAGTFESIYTRIYELDAPIGEAAPMYWNDNIKKLATLEPPLNNIEMANIPIRRGKDGKDYYKVDFEIHAAYFSAHSEYSLWYEGKDHGSVKVDYA